MCGCRNTLPAVRLAYRLEGARDESCFAATLMCCCLLCVSLLRLDIAESLNL